MSSTTWIVMWAIIGLIIAVIVGLYASYDLNYLLEKRSYNKKLADPETDTEKLTPPELWPWWWHIFGYSVGIGVGTFIFIVCGWQYRNNIAGALEEVVDAFAEIGCELAVIGAFILIPVFYKAFECLFAIVDSWFH